MVVVVVAVVVVVVVLVVVAPSSSRSSSSSSSSNSSRRRRRRCGDSGSGHGDISIVITIVAPIAAGIIIVISIVRIVFDCY